MGKALSGELSSPCDRSYLACLKEVQEKLLHYPCGWRRRWRSQNVKVFMSKFFM